ncbi:SRPBCC family protein [Microbacterium sp. gxy059]|uniref:SRPBCC family protein n=1 Tax=Microbacterium sp. gxy059 TaxID=2957199 RepID=UPI003D967339
MPSLVLVTSIAAPPEACFALSLSVDAHSASMAGTDERAVAGVTAGEMALGETVTWSARHFGVRFRMTSRITACEPPLRFVDEQIAGPFGRWWHEHLFQATADGTRMIDHIEYASPFGPLGRLVDRVVLARYMNGLIARRNRWLAEALAGAAPRERAV